MHSTLFLLLTAVFGLVLGLPAKPRRALIDISPVFSPTIVTDDNTSCLSLIAGCNPVNVDGEQNAESTGQSGATRTSSSAVQAATTTTAAEAGSGQTKTDDDDGSLINISPVFAPTIIDEGNNECVGLIATCNPVNVNGTQNN